MSELLHWGDVARAVDGVQAVIDDPKLLRPFAKRLADRTKAFIEGGGDGWAPPAPATLKKWQQGTSDATRHGKIRQSKIVAVNNRIKRLAARADKAGWSDQDRKNLASLKKRAAKLRAAPAAAGVVADKAEARAGKASGLAGRTDERVGKAKDRLETLRQQLDDGKKRKPEQRAKLLERITKAGESIERAIKAADRAAKALPGALDAAKTARYKTTYKGRDIGPRQAETRKLMGRMPSTIRTKIKRREEGGVELVVYSKAGEVGYYHDQGLARNAPKRQIIPDPSEEDMAALVELIEQAALDAWES